MGFLDEDGIDEDEDGIDEDEDGIDEDEDGIGIGVNEDVLLSGFSAALVPDSAHLTKTKRVPQFLISFFAFSEPAGLNGTTTDLPSF